MLREKLTVLEIDIQIAVLYSELQRRVSTMDLHSFERMCRKIHGLQIKKHSFRGGLYDKS